jgi:hypothetical protein
VCMEFLHAYARRYSGDICLNDVVKGICHVLPTLKEVETVSFVFFAFALARPMTVLPTGRN